MLELSIVAIYHGGLGLEVVAGFVAEGPPERGE